MTDDIVLLSQVEFLYNSTAKQLYNLTLLAIGDQLSAERITIDAFAYAFQDVEDKSNLSLFINHCVKHIYRSCKRDCKTVTYNINETVHENSDESRTVKSQKLLKLLSMQSLKDRFLLLLYCQQRLTTRQIAEGLNLPVFFIRNRFFRVLSMAGKYMDLK
jgi:hypothetical protein